MKFNINEGDPVAEQLHGTTNFRHEVPDPEEVLQRELRRDARVKQIWDESMARRENMEKCNARLSELHPLADYETYHYIGSDDPFIIDFLEGFGFDPTSLKKIIMTMETGEPVKIETEGYLSGSKSNGSLWKHSYEKKEEE